MAVYLSDSSVESDREDDSAAPELTIHDLQQNDATSCGIYAGFVYPLLLGRFRDHVTLRGLQTYRAAGSQNFILQAAYAIAHIVHVQGYHDFVEKLSGEIKLTKEKASTIFMRKIHNESLLIDVTPDSLILVEPRNANYPHIAYKGDNKVFWKIEDFSTAVQDLGNDLFSKMNRTCLQSHFVMDIASIFSPLLEFRDGTYYTYQEQLYKEQNISFLAKHLEQSERGAQQPARIDTRVDVIKKIALAQYFQTILDLESEEDSTTDVFFIRYMPGHYGLDVIQLNTLGINDSEDTLYVTISELNTRCVLYDSLNGTATVSHDYGSAITRLATLHNMNGDKMYEFEKPKTINRILKQLKFKRSDIRQRKKTALDVLIEDCCSYMHVNKQEEVQFVVFALADLREKIRVSTEDLLFPDSLTDATRVPRKFEAFKKHIQNIIKNYVLIRMDVLHAEGDVIVEKVHSREVKVEINFADNPWLLLAGWDENWNFSEKRKIKQIVRYELEYNSKDDKNIVTEPTVRKRAEKDGKEWRSITKRNGIRVRKTDFIIKSCKGQRPKIKRLQDCENFKKSVEEEADYDAYKGYFACYHHFIALVAIQYVVESNMIDIQSVAQKRAERPQTRKIARKLDFAAEDSSADGSDDRPLLTLTSDLKSFTETLIFAVIYAFVGKYGINILQRSIKETYMESNSGNEFIKSVKEPSKKLRTASNVKAQIQQIISEYITKSRKFIVQKAGTDDEDELQFNVLQGEDVFVQYTKPFAGSTKIHFMREGADTDDDDMEEYFIKEVKKDIDEDTNNGAATGDAKGAAKGSTKKKRRQGKGIYIARDSKYIDINI